MLTIGLAVALIPCSLLLLWLVHGALQRVCVGHARRFCRRRGFHANRVRWRPAFDETGVKTEFTLVQLDCFDPQKERRLVTLLAWPFGVWKQVGDEVFPDSANLLPAGRWFGVLPERDGPLNSYTKYVKELEAAYKIYAAILRQPPSALLDGWKSFVCQCEEGYPFDISEYDNDIIVRGQIEFLLSIPQLQIFDELHDFAKKIYEVDDKFRAILLAGVVRPYTSSKWWERGVLSYAREDYVSDMKSLYGINVTHVRH